MKTLSIRQPWASLIVDGDKDVENRTWSTPYRGRILVHASKSIDRAAMAIVLEDYPDWSIADFPAGGVIGSVEIVDCVTHSDSEWFEGPYGFVLSDPQPCEFIPAKGKLGLFDLEIAEPT